MYHYINFFNETDAVLSGQMSIYTTLMSVELLLMIFTSSVVVVIIYLNIVTELYHRNMRLIFSFYISTYLIHNVGNTVQLLLVLLGGPTTPLLFEMSSYIRVISIFCAVLILPAFVCERLCATYFLNDYEGRQRPSVGRLIILLNALSATAVGLLFQSERPICYFVIFFVFLNALAQILNCVLAHVNRRYYFRCQNGQSEYSLGERFQISENLKASKIWSKVGMSIAFFNVVCTSALLVDDFSVSPCVMNIAVVVFNYCIHCYAMTLCAVTYTSNKPWQAKLYRLFKKDRVEPIESSLRNSFGEQMHVTTAEQSNTYFNLLRKDWS